MRILQISHPLARQIFQHALREKPNEACGMILGKGHRATEMIAITNVADNPENRYLMNPTEQLKAFKRIDASDDVELIGVYHSHPNHPPIPSQTDIEEAFYPDLTQVIISLQHSQPEMLGWHIHDGQVDSVRIIVGEQTIDTTLLEDFSTGKRMAIVLATAISVLLLIVVAIILLPPPPDLSTLTP